MTAVTHYIAQLTDIVTIRLECRECGTVMAYRPEKRTGDKIPSSCTNCHATWFLEGSSDKINFEELATVLRTLVGLKNCPMQFSFEFQAPKA